MCGWRVNWLTCQTTPGFRSTFLIWASISTHPAARTDWRRLCKRFRLVKGAYVEPSDRALPYGECTDIAYLRVAHRLTAAKAPFAAATLDSVLREALLTALGPITVEQLLGVRPEVLDDLVARDVSVRVYVPFGHNWFRYWMRRIARCLAGYDLFRAVGSKARITEQIIALLPPARTLRGACAGSLQQTFVSHT